MTPAATATRQGTTEAIVRNQWDRRDFARAVDSVPLLAETLQEVTEASDLAPAAVGDLFAALLKAVPEQPDVADMRRTHVVNHTIAGEILATDSLRELRRWTRSNPISAAMGAVAIAGRLPELYKRLEPVAREADKAQAAQDALDAFLEGHGDVPLDPEGEIELEGLAGDVGEAMAALDGALAEAAPTIGSLVRAGVNEAAHKASDTAAAMRGMGLDLGQVMKADPARRLALAARLDNPTLRRIAKKMGALHAFAGSKRRSRTRDVRHERNDTTYGNDLNQVLPSEFIGLGHPAMRRDFYDRFLRRRLLQHDMDGEEELGHGAIIFEGDGSGSMAGDRFEYCKGLGGAFLRLAKDEGRPFHAIDFGGPGQFESFPFPDPASFEPERILNYFEHAYEGAGTCFETPLNEAVRLLEEDFAATGRVSADIVFVTDGYAYVSDEWLAEFKATQRRLKFRVFRVAVGPKPANDPSAAIFDHTFDMHDLVDNKDVDQLFRAIP